MENFQVRYDSRVVIYDRRGFIRLATECSTNHLRVVASYYDQKTVPMLETCWAEGH